MLTGGHNSPFGRQPHDALTHADYSSVVQAKNLIRIDAISLYTHSNVLIVDRLTSNLIIECISYASTKNFVLVRD